jgi:hypothetical protein
LDEVFFNVNQSPLKKQILENNLTLPKEQHPDGKKKLGFGARLVMKVIQELYETFYFYMCPYIIFAFVALFKWKDKSIDTECKEFLDGFHKLIRDKVKHGANGLSEKFTKDAWLKNDTS